MAASESLIATRIGDGCRVEGPHGPTPCGSSTTEPGGPECDCGCSAFEDACAAYIEWSASRQAEADAAVRARRHERLRPRNFSSHGDA